MFVGGCSSETEPGFCDEGYVPSMEVIVGEEEAALGVFTEIGQAALNGVFNYEPPKQYSGDPIASTHKQLLDFLVSESSSGSIIAEAFGDENKIDEVGEVFCTINPEKIDELNEKRALRPIENSANPSDNFTNEVPEFYNPKTLYLNNEAFTILDIVATQLPIINNRNAITPPQEEEDIQPPITFSINPLDIFEHMRFVISKQETS